MGTDEEKLLEQDHLQWLRKFDYNYSDKFKKLFRADREAALFEARTRQFLSTHVDRIEPAEGLRNGGPDFLCFQDNDRFYAEATCIKKSTVTNKIEKRDLFNLLTDLIKTECTNKAKQCSQRKDAPCLLVIGTFHMDASMLIHCHEDLVPQILTSELSYCVPIDIVTGNSLGDGELSTDFKTSIFLRPGKEEDIPVEPARKSISALLLCGFGCNHPEVKGILNVDAERTFDEKLLPEIPFCQCHRVRKCREERLKTEWIQVIE